uniref:Fibronectin type-III domain-containing protein 3A n=1 Tax=Nothobranchius furzeri TaxID=105023 RepID=A0A8C6LHG6_NOTFU
MRGTVSSGTLFLFLQAKRTPELFFMSFHTWCNNKHVILVQVNPGEAFTIRREDGQYQCITGPAQVPMMSPNGSVPPIYVPPGYVSQIIEENGVRRVLVLPQQPDFHPGGHSPLHHPPPPPHAHLPAFIPHPAMMPPPPHLYTGIAGGVGDLSSQYISQYHPAQFFSDQVSTDSLSQHGRPSFVHRDDRASKAHERLQKKVKERQGVGGGGGQVKDSPPPSPRKSCNSPPTVDIQNGIGGKALDAEHRHVVACSDKQTELDKETQALLALLSNITKPEVSDIQAREAVVNWSDPTRPESENTTTEEEPVLPEPLSYEISISITGKDGKYQSKYRYKAFDHTPPSYGALAVVHFYVTFSFHLPSPSVCPCMCLTRALLSLSPILSRPLSFSALPSEFSEVVDLFTSCSVPLPPFPPELEMAGVTWLCLKWQRPSSSPKEDDIYYILEMEEEDSGYGFQPSYDGDELSFTVRNLHRSSKYKFRVAAYNSEGKSNPSQVVEFITKPDRPSCPCRPVIRGRVQPDSFKMAWEPPKENGGAEITKYVVELSEGVTGASWELVYSGSALEHVCGGLKPGCSYRTRVYCMSEGGQSPTPAVPPGPCQPPRLVGKPKAREVQLRWGPPHIDGGSPVTCFSVEVIGPQSDESREVYQGPELDCTVGGLSPGRTYGFRLKAANKAGFGPLSERCEVTTGPGAPEQCKAPSTTCKSPSCVVVSWEAPPCNGAPVTEFRLEWGAAEGSMQVCYSGAGLSHEMKGLLPATNYFCRVQLQRYGSPVDADEDEEGGVIHPPLAFSPSTCLGICWDAPCDHGSEITSYLIDLGEKQPIVVGPVTKYVIQNLQPDTSYRIRIQAQNSLGTGAFSHTFKLKTKPLPPQPPRLECTAFSHQTLRLKWGDGPAKTAASDTLQSHLQMEDKNGRFISLYKGPCHTHKVQRLNESTSYTFRIQAFNEAGEGPFSSVYTFTTPRSPPAPLKAPKLERLDDNSCEVTWESLSHMKGDPISYSLQCMMGNTEFKQAYKGSATSFLVQNLQANSDYRFRVCAIRQCQDATELSGPYSPTVTLTPQRSETVQSGGAAGSGSRTGTESNRTRQSLTDEQCAFLLLMVFAVIAILIAFVIQYFVIK